MGFLDGLLGHRKPASPDLDRLFTLPAASFTLAAALGFEPTGEGAVAFRAVEGLAFDDLQDELRAILGIEGGAPVRAVADSFGYQWLVRRTAPPDVGSLVTELHAVNTTLAEHGFGPTLLCTTVMFVRPDGQRLAMVYLYKQGTFYPFAALAGHDQRRDQLLEIQVRDALVSDLPVEPEPGRWFALWDAPGV
jgi:hypothetical protein